MASTTMRAEIKSVSVLLKCVLVSLASALAEMLSRSTLWLGECQALKWFSMASLRFCRMMGSLAFGIGHRAHHVRNRTEYAPYGAEQFFGFSSGSFLTDGL
ncbi:hypothetical protein [Flavobacterium caeni]|uniref:hypothetical protein n=1 Tax=Flavobacterium caeni TaxID=490189 RepID=UPI00147B4567|nr:hypothetical protein [Flavobacterium caeni]